MSSLTLYYAPHSRSVTARMLIEELGAPYEMKLLNLQAGDQKKPDYLKINPLGKVPAIVHDGAVVTEQTAICMYLADTFPKAGLAPAIGDRLRGPYLRWFAFYAACFEPALTDKAMQRDAGEPRMLPYGSYDAVVKAVQEQFAAGPWWLGEKFTALDVQWGSALSWMTQFGIMPKTPTLEAYLQRFTARPAIAKCLKEDAEMAAKMKAA